MTQNDLNRAVARATGESIGEISRRGFVPLTDIPIEVESDPEEKIIDWDEHELSRSAVLVAS